MNLKVVFNKILIEFLCCGILSKTAMLFGDLYMKLFDCNLSHFDTWPLLPPLKINKGTLRAGKTTGKNVVWTS